VGVIERETQAERTWRVVEAGAVDGDAETGACIAIGEVWELFILRLLVAASGGGRRRRRGRGCGRGRREAGEEGGGDGWRDAPVSGATARDARGETAEDGGGGTPKHLDGDESGGGVTQSGLGRSWKWQCVFPRAG
jgi:hypothetical protein